MARAYERWDRVRTMESPAGYVYRVGVNLNRQRLRHLAVRARRLFAMAGHPDSQQPLEVRRDIADAIASLSRGQREAFMLVEWLGMGAEEAGRILGLAPGSVRSRVHRARPRSAIDSATMEATVDDVKHRIRRELERLEPSPGGLEKTLRRARQRQRNRRAGAATLGILLTTLLVVGLWMVRGPGPAPGPGPASSPEFTPGTITLPDSSFLPEGTLLVQTGSGQVLRHGEAQSESLGTDLIPLDLSRDGSEVLARAGDELVSVNLETGERSVLVRAPDGEQFGAAEWSPDGGTVAFSVGASDPAEKSTLCVFALSSQSTRCFAEVGRAYEFDWSPDGSELVVAGPPADPLHLVDVSAGRTSTLVAQEGSTPINRAIAERGWGEAFQLVNPMWSASGQYLAALANLRGSELAYVPVVFTSAGEPVAFGQPSSEFPEPFAWSPAQDVLAYTQGEAPYRITEARLLDPASGQDRVLVSSGGKAYPDVTDLVWSPSGQWLAVALWQPDGGEGSLSLRVFEATDPEHFKQADIDTAGVSRLFVAWRP